MHRGQEEASRSRGNQEHEPALASLKGEEECDAEWEKGRENVRGIPDAVEPSLEKATEMPFGT
uniref:Uncharacterized protein n=1 Tax=Oryza barthii TaxID=65489 RepID=A0A0D3HKM1_9ORYZ